MPKYALTPMHGIGTAAPKPRDITADDVGIEGEFVAFRNRPKIGGYGELVELVPSADIKRVVRKP